jgi:uncharacterized membrane protein YdjX (TVP38/TMEM64 family)
VASLRAFALNRYWMIAGVILALFLTTYLLVEAVGVEVLTDPRPTLDRAGPIAALLGILLLVADQFVPVPSSLVMTSLGALYGAPIGVALAMTGRVAMAAVGFAVGRAGGPMLERLLTAKQRSRADTLLRNWGAMAILASRPLPLISETVTIMAGASPLPWRRSMLAAAIGCLPEAVSYSLAGSIAPTFENVGLIWGSFAALAGGFWFLNSWAERRRIVDELGEAGGPSSDLRVESVQ